MSKSDFYTTCCQEASQIKDGFICEFLSCQAEAFQVLVGPEQSLVTFHLDDLTDKPLYCECGEECPPAVVEASHLLGVKLLEDPAYAQMDSRPAVQCALCDLVSMITATPRSDSNPTNSTIDCSNLNLNMNHINNNNNNNNIEDPLAFMHDDDAEINPECLNNPADTHPSPRSDGLPVDTLQERMAQECLLRERQYLASQVPPSAADWRAIILPSLREHLLNVTHLQRFEADEWLSRVEIEIFQRFDEERAFRLCADALRDTSPPDSLVKFFPLRYRGSQILAAGDRLKAGQGKSRPSKHPAVSPSPSRSPGPSSLSESPRKHKAPSPKQSPPLPFASESVSYHLRQPIPDATVSALLKQYRLFQSHPRRKRIPGIKAELISQNLLHWRVAFFGFSADSPLSSDLAHLASKSIELELLFPTDFPLRPPLLRLISPPLQLHLNPSQSLAAVQCGAIQHPDFNALSTSSSLTTSSLLTTSSTSSSTTTSSSTSCYPSDTLPECEVVSVETCYAVTVRRKWRPSTSSFAEFLRHLRHLISKQASIDPLALPRPPLHTVHQFWQEFLGIPASLSGRSSSDMGGKLVLPLDAMELLVPSSPLDGSNPSSEQLLFEMSVAGSLSFAYVGALDFTADPGTVIIPDHLLPFFGSVPDAPLHVALRLVSLPKAERIVLHIDDPRRWSAVLDRKALLEWHLPHWPALTVGNQIPVVDVGLGTYTFTVVEVHPGPAVCTTDADVETEFRGESFASSEGASVPLNASTQIERKSTPSTSFSSLPIPLSSSIQSASIPSSSSSSSSIQSKSSSIPSSPIQSTSNSSSSSTTSTSSSSSSSSTVLSNKSSIRHPNKSNESTPFDPTLHFICDLCRQTLSLRTRVLHEAQCARHNHYCEECQTVVKIAEMEQHVLDYHSIEACPLGCGVQTSHAELQVHLECDCPNRLVSCLFCGLGALQHQISAHESTCGDKTSFCLICQKYVRRREITDHRLTVCPQAVFDSD